MCSHPTPFHPLHHHIIPYTQPSFFHPATHFAITRPLCPLVLHSSQSESCDTQLLRMVQYPLVTPYRPDQPTTPHSHIRSTPVGVTNPSELLLWTNNLPLMLYHFDHGFHSSYHGPMKLSSSLIPPSLLPSHFPGITHLDVWGSSYFHCLVLICGCLVPGHPMSFHRLRMHTGHSACIFLMVSVADTLL
jgi:hypothetical protein